MHIETFKGRKGRYNKQIFRALYEKGCLSSWKIAKEIVYNDLKRQKRNWYHETQKVNSVLARRGGRLEDLVNKEFIEKINQDYYLTIYKGFCTALTLYEKVREPAIDESSRAYEVFPELKEAEEIISRLHPGAVTEKYKVMREATEELLNKGLNLGVVSNRQFNAFFNDQMNVSSLQELKKERENREKWEPNPELQECTLRLMDRMKKILLDQVREFDKELNSFKESIRKASARKKEN